MPETPSRVPRVSTAATAWPHRITPLTTMMVAPMMAIPVRSSRKSCVFLLKTSVTTISGPHVPLERSNTHGWQREPHRGHDGCVPAGGRRIVLTTVVMAVAPTPSMFAPVSTPALAIREVSFLVLAIAMFIFIVVAGLTVDRKSVV